jgi:hypothetical protein
VALANATHYQGRAVTVAAMEAMMRVAVMQPYLFPYAGYFALVANVDLFVFYDDAAFNNRSWYNRNRILAPGKEWEYLRLSVKHASRGTPVRDVVLDDPEKDRARAAFLLSAYRRAPHYQEVAELVDSIFALRTSSLNEIASRSVAEVSAYLNLSTRFTWSSKLSYDRQASATEKILQLCEAAGGSHYVNLPGGRPLYDDDDFTRRGIQLQFIEMPPMEYAVAGFEFVPSLSIVDVMMWCERDTIVRHISNRT